MTGSVNVLGEYIDTSPFTLQNGKIKCALDGAVYAEMTANASTASANGWIQVRIQFEFPDGTLKIQQISHVRTISANVGMTCHGNIFMSITAGTLISTYLQSANGGATLGNTYWLKVGYLYVPVNK